MFWGFSNPQNNLKIGVADFSSLEYQLRKNWIQMVQFINNHKHSTSFLFLAISFNPSWEFQGLEIRHGSFWGLILGPEIIFRLWFSPNHPAPPPPHLPPWLMMSYYFVEWIFNKFSTFYVIWVETTRKYSFFPRSHHDSAQAYFATFSMRFSDS